MYLAHHSVPHELNASWRRRPASSCPLASMQIPRRSVIERARSARHVSCAGEWRELVGTRQDGLEHRSTAAPRIHAHRSMFRVRSLVCSPRLQLRLAGRGSACGKPRSVARGVQRRLASPAELPGGFDAEQEGQLLACDPSPQESGLPSVNAVVGSENAFYLISEYPRLGERGTWSLVQVPRDISQSPSGT